MCRLAIFRTRLAIQVLALLAVGALAFGSVATAAPPAQSADEGQKLFTEKCVACHTIGKGPLVGPDLQGVTTQRDPAWLTKWLSAPDQMLAATLNARGVGVHPCEGDVGVLGESVLV